MRGQTEALPGHAATLQCIAASFREQADDPTARGVELRRFATVLDHMAASLLVPSMPALALVAGVTVDHAGQDEDEAARGETHPGRSDRVG